MLISIQTLRGNHSTAVSHINSGTKIVSELQTHQVTDQVTDQVARLLAVLDDTPELSSSELMSRLELNHRASFRNTYLGPALVSGCVEMTDPDSPRSPAQKYRLTEKGRARVRP